MKHLIKGVIDEVVVDSTKIQPIIVDFQNGALKDEVTDQMKCGLFYDQKEDKTILALSNDQIVYKGYRPNPESDLMQTMMVIHNKSTGKIRLVQAERWQVSPILHNSPLDIIDDDNINRLSSLYKQFGSKKSKKRAEQSERMKINVDTAKEQLEKSISNIEIDTLDMTLPGDTLIESTFLPECNRDAKNVTDVYNINEIIPIEKLQCLYSKAKEISSKPVTGQSNFFTKTIAKLKSEPEGFTKIAILMYVEAAATWISMPLKNAKKKDTEISSFSRDINSHIVESYSVQSSYGRSRPNSMKDKCLIHCMILALNVSNFSLDLELFSSAFKLRLGIKRLTQLARIVGALPKKDDKKIVILGLPLPAPISQIPKIKRK